MTAVPQIWSDGHGSSLRLSRRESGVSDAAPSEGIALAAVRFAGSVAEGRTAVVLALHGPLGRGFE